MSKLSFEDVVDFIRNFHSISNRKIITLDTRLEADLGITGDDGDDMLLEASEQFKVDILSLEAGISKILELGPNEYVFGPEGCDPIGMTALYRLLKGKPSPVYRDMTVGELYYAIQDCYSN